MSAPYYEQGNYACQITAQAVTETKNGNPQLVLRFKVLGPSLGNGEYEPASPAYERTFYRVITDKTVEYVVEDLKALGYQHQSFRFLDPKTPGFQDFSGKVLEMYCKHEPDDKGNVREKWMIARSSSGISDKPLEPKKLRELDNLFGKFLKAGAAKVAPPAAAAVGFETARHVAADGTEITDDDIPF